MLLDRNQVQKNDAEFAFCSLDYVPFVAEMFYFLEIILIKIKNLKLYILTIFDIGIDFKLLNIL